jgi:hypothetical protein
MLPSHRPVFQRIGLTLTLVAASVLGSTAVGTAADANPNPPSIYAAPDGHGRDCSAAVPCSIQHAKQTAKDRARHLTEDLRVVLAGGTYTLAAPLSFSPADSGRNGHRIIWQAAAGQHPVLSGGTPVSGFTQSPSNPALWSAPVPAGLQTRQLYADGVRIPRAAGPSPVALTQTSAGYQAADATLAGWRNPQNIELVFDGGNGAWTQPRCDVASISGSTITMRQPCWSNLHLPGTPVAPDGDNPAGGFFGLGGTATPTLLENAFELLSPGHWYLDEEAHRVYYDARDTDNVPAMHFIAPALQQLVTTTSTADQPLHDVTFRGLGFDYATWLQPSGNDGFAEMQANMTVTGAGGATSQGLCQYVSPKGTCPFASWTRPPAAVDLTGTQRVSILDNTFEHLGSAGLGLMHGIQGDRVDGNEVTDVSGIGILFGAIDDPQPTAYAMIQLAGTGSLDLSDVQARSGAEIAADNTISNNYVHSTGVEYTGAPGIVAGYARRTTITHNELADLPYSGISFGWGGWHTNATTPDTNPNINADNVISDNVIYHVMEVRSDGGPVYTNGPQGSSLAHGLTISGNVTFANKNTLHAIYNDEGGAYIVTDGNVQYNDSGSFNGGCSTTGHIVLRGNYYVGQLNQYGCDNAGTDFVDGGGNVRIPQSPAPGDVPAGVLGAAGLPASYAAALTASHRPAVAAVSLIRNHQVRVSGSGFTSSATVAINGQPAGRVTTISSNQLIATLPSTVAEGDVTVATAAGTSAVTSDSYTEDPALNIAVGRPASQSSTAFGAPPQNAVDGNTDGVYSDGSISHTGDDVNAWWQVDLGNANQIQQISVYNRTDCCSDRLTDYWVFVSPTPFDTSLTPVRQAAQPGVWSNHQTGTAGTPTRIPGPATGRYVMVQLAGTNYLSLAEVQVLGTN